MARLKYILKIFSRPLSPPAKLDIYLMCIILVEEQAIDDMGIELVKAPIHKELVCSVS